MLAFVLILAQLREPQTRPFASLGLHELAERFPTPSPTGQSMFRDSQDEQLFFELDFRIGKGARLSLEDWRCILLDRGWLRWRDRWPQGLPFAVGMHRPPFFYSNTFLELVPRVKDWKPARWEPKPCCTDSVERYECEDYQVLGSLTEPETSIEFDLYDIPCDRRTGSARTPIGSITLHVRAVKSFEDCLPPLKDKQREAEIGRGLARALILYRASDRSTGEARYLTLDPAVRTPGVALGLAAILRQAGQPSVQTWGIPLGARRDFRWEAGGGYFENSKRAEEAESLGERLELMKPIPHAFDSLVVAGQTLVLRGAPRYALRDWDATQYWAGEIEVRLEDVIRR